MMNNQITNIKTYISGLKKPVMAVFLVLFIILALSLIVLPSKAEASTTATSTTTNIIVPIQGYYYYIDRFGNYKPCDMANCGAYGPFANMQGFADFRSTYKPTPTVGTGYGTSYSSYVKQYQPYTKSYSTYASNNYMPSSVNSGSIFNNPVYSQAEYKPYEKVGNTLKTTNRNAPAKYAFGTNGLANNSYSNYGYGNNYGQYGSNNYGSGFAMTNPSYGSGYGSNNGGFQMTSSGY